MPSPPSSRRFRPNRSSGWCTRPRWSRPLRRPRGVAVARLRGQFVREGRLPAPRLRRPRLAARGAHREEYDGEPRVEIVKGEPDMTSIAHDDPVVVIIGSVPAAAPWPTNSPATACPACSSRADATSAWTTGRTTSGPAFGRMAWLDMRTTSGSYRITKGSNLPAWIVKAVGGTTTHWSGATPRFMAHKVEGPHALRRHRGREPARLADRRRRDGALVRQGRGRDRLDAPARPSRSAGQRNYKVFANGAERAG